MDPYLLLISAPIPDPLAELRPPVLDDVGLRVFSALAVPKPALRTDASHDVHRPEIYLQPFGGLGRDLVLGTPGAALLLLV